MLCLLHLELHPICVCHITARPLPNTLVASPQVSHLEHCSNTESVNPVKNGDFLISSNYILSDARCTAAPSPVQLLDSRSPAWNASRLYFKYLCTSPSYG